MADSYGLVFGDNLNDPNARRYVVGAFGRDKAIVDFVVGSILSGRTPVYPPLTERQVLEVIACLNVASGGEGWQVGSE